MNIFILLIAFSMWFWGFAIMVHHRYKKMPIKGGTIVIVIAGILLTFISFI